MNYLTPIVNIDDFFNPKYKCYNKGFGIGGVGIISPINNIFVFNLDDYEKNSNSIIKNFIGPHDDTFSIVLGLMFGLVKSADLKKYQPENIVYKDNRKALNSMISKKAYSGKVIRIYLANTKGENTIMIYAPSIITPKEYNDLVALYKWINKAQMRNTFRISAAVMQSSAFNGEYFDDDAEENLMQLINYFKENNRIRQFFLEGERNIAYREIEEPR